MIWLESVLALLLERLGETVLVVGLLARGLVVLALCAAALTLLRRSASTWRHEVALSGMLVAAALPVVVALGEGGAIFLTLPRVGASLLAAPYAPADVVARLPGDEASPVPPADSIADGSSRAVLGAPAWSPEPLPAIWLGGAGALFLFWSARHLVASVRLRPWRPVPRAWRDRLRTLGASRRQATRLALSAGAPVPLVWGALRPRIVLPLEAGEWDEGRLEIALRHELAHVRRGDPLTRCAAGLATLVHWPNPLAWLTRDRLELERELACDRDVIAGGIAPSTYARELLAMVTGLPDGNGRHRRLAMAERLHIKRRIREAIEAPQTAPPRLRPARVLMAFAVGVVAIVVSSLHAAPDSASSAQGTVASRRLEVLGGSDLERLAAALRSGDLGALRARGRLSVPRRAVAPLVDALGDPHPGVRRVAAWALGETRSRRAGAALRNALLDPDPRVRAAAAHALGDVGGERDVPGLTRALDDPDPEVRLRAAHALGDRRDPRALDALVSRLTDDRAAVADMADWALREILDTLDVYGLVLASKHPEARVRFHATHFLGDKADRDTVAPLVALLSDSDPATRIKAAWALGEVADAGAVEALTALWTSGEESVEVRAVAAKAARRSR